MAVYVGINGNSKKKISSLYVGKSGSKKEVIEGYYGNSKRQVYSCKPDPGQVVFTTSGTFTVPKRVKKVDIFLVGGGGKGMHVSSGWETGGGGGFTKTIKGVSVSPGSTWSVIVGEGDKGSGSVNITIGGSSSALGYEASGGYSGYPMKGVGSSMVSNVSYGGSGGGWQNGNGGSDGGNGYWFANTYGYPELYDSNIMNGQGTTTRAFGESTGTLYAGGGGGINTSFNSTDSWYTTGGDGGGGNGGWSDGNYNGGGLTSGSPNTGGGSGAGGVTPPSYGFPCTTGGSGIVIIRWGY